jgi:hypothetical protein
MTLNIPDGLVETLVAAWLAFQGWMFAELVKIKSKLDVTDERAKGVQKALELKQTEKT